MYGIIYKLTCLITWKVYVGQTTRTLEKSIEQHKYGNLYVDRAIRKYGWENFTVEILEECDTREQLNERERYWIAHLNCKVPNGYNLADGGEGASGWTHTSEARSKMSAAQLGNKKCLGHHHSAETRKKIATSHEGQCRPNELCAKLSVARRGDTPYRNLSDAITARKLSYTTLARLMGLAVMTVSDKMRGACRFTAKDVAKLVAIFDLPAEYLMERDDGLPIMLSKRGETSYKNLSDEMEKRQLSYKDLAKLIDLSSGSVSFKMCGKINFTARDIAKLVEIFDLPAEYLMMRDN